MRFPVILELSLKNESLRHRAAPDALFFHCKDTDWGRSFMRCLLSPCAGRIPAARRPSTLEMCGLTLPCLEMESEGYEEECKAPG